MIIDPGAVIALSEDASAAALGAVAASLENVLRHSGVHSAEVIVGADDSTVSMMQIPGNIETHHAVTISSRPSAIITPHAGENGLFG